MMQWLRKFLGDFLGLDHIDLLESKIGELEARVKQDAEAFERRVTEKVVEKVAKMFPLDSLTLVSPNGKQKIILTAQDNCSGIWIMGERGEPLVAIYKEATQGACVGLWGPADGEGNRRGGLDAALAYDLSSGGYVQLIDQENSIHDLTCGLVAGFATGNVTKFALKGMKGPVGVLPPV